jgi:hypothetical protein
MAGDFVSGYFVRDFAVPNATDTETDPGYFVFGMDGALEKFALSCGNSIEARVLSSCSARGGQVAVMGRRLE